MFSGHVLCIYTFALYISIYSVLALLKIVFVYLACVCASLKCMQLQVNCKWCINKSMYGRVETNKALDCYSCQCNLRLQVNKHLYTIQTCPNVLPMCIWTWILDDRSWTLYICACTCPWSPSDVFFPLRPKHIKNRFNQSAQVLWRQLKENERDACLMNALNLVLVVLLYTVYKMYFIPCMSLWNWLRLTKSNWEWLFWNRPAIPICI